MPRLDTGQPHQLAYRRRLNAACRALGFCCVCLGLVLAVAPLLGQQSGASRPLLAAGAIAGWLSFVGGLGLAAGRVGRQFDLQEGTVVFWWGVIWPWRQTEYPLGEFQAVAVEYPPETQRQVFIVGLQAADGSLLEVLSAPTPSAAWRAAHELAEFLRWPLHQRGAPPMEIPPGPAAQ